MILSIPFDIIEEHILFLLNAIEIKNLKNTCKFFYKTIPISWCYEKIYVTSLTKLSNFKFVDVVYLSSNHKIQNLKINNKYISILLCDSAKNLKNIYFDTHMKYLTQIYLHDIPNLKSINLFQIANLEIFRITNTALLSPLNPFIIPHTWTNLLKCSITTPPCKFNSGIIIVPKECVNLRYIVVSCIKKIIFLPIPKNLVHIQNQFSANWELEVLKENIKFITHYPSANIIYHT